MSSYPSIPGPENINVGAQQEEESINIRDFMALCTARWKWFVLSVGFFVALALLYLVTTAPSYSRIATVMIKSEEGGMESTIASQFADLGFGGSNADVNNELLAFQSPALLSDVIQRLNLDVSYSWRPKLKRLSLYGDSLPIEVQFLDLKPDQGASFTMTPDGKGKLLLEKIKYSEAPQGTEFEPMVVKVGGVYQTPAGRVAFLPGPAYDVTKETPIKVKKSPIADAVEGYQSELDFTLTDDKASVIDISITDKSIQRAEDVLKTIIDVYNEKWVEDKNLMAITTSQFINDRLQVIEQELGHVDNDISDFKSRTLTPDLQVAAQLAVERSDANMSRILDITTGQAITRYLRDYIAQTTDAGRLIPTNTGLNNPAIEAQVAEYNKLQLERDDYEANSGATNPVVKDYDRKLRAMRTAIIGALDNHLGTLDMRLRSIDRNDNQNNSRIASAPGQAKYLLSVERQQKVKEELYLFLLQKREENELSRAFTAYNTRIITPAFGNKKPASPNKRNILILAFLIGLIIPAVIIFVNENLNTFVRNRADLDGLRVPYMGEIPMAQHISGSVIKRNLRAIRRALKRGKGNSSEPPVFVVKAQGRSVINEAFRSLRTNIEFMTADIKGTPTIMSTSFNPGSGKSFVILNLAAAFAVKTDTARILAIDLDLRMAALSNAVNNPARGIADYLAGTANDLDKLIVPSSVKGLDILPVGTIPPNPSELLYSDRLKAIFDQLKGKYDYIFLDCPPSEIVTDASIITKHANMTLFVVRAGLLDRRLLPRLDQYYVEHKFNNLCVVLNGTMATESPYRKYSYSSYYHKDED